MTQLTKNVPKFKITFKCLLQKDSTGVVAEESATALTNVQVYACYLQILETSSAEHNVFLCISTYV